VTVAAGRLAEATLVTAPLARTIDSGATPMVLGPFRRTVLHVGDLLGTIGIVLCIPFVILAIGIPIALCLRLLLWIGGLL
jgi:hypothetical protein